MAKILYVEDNDDNIYMLKLRLERKAYIVVIANDGQSAIEIAKKEKPDLILMDVGLPVMDGYEATKILKNDQETKEIPIIILTAHALITDEQKAKDVGANDFETKPINVVRLLEKMEKLLKQIKG